MNETEQLLNHLSQEAHEVSEAVNALGIRASKAALFGMDEVQAGQDLTNAQRIVACYFKVIDEMADLVGVLEMLLERTPEVAIETEIPRHKIDAKKLKVAEWRKFAADLRHKEWKAEQDEKEFEEDYRQKK